MNDSKNPYSPPIPQETLESSAQKIVRVWTMFGYLFLLIGFLFCGWILARIWLHDGSVYAGNFAPETVKIVASIIPAGFEILFIFGFFRLLRHKRWPDRNHL